MYNLKYESSNGKSINFSPLEHIILTKVDGLTQVNTELSTSQGMNQIGTTIQGRSVKDKLITIEGTFIGASSALRRRLIDTLVPLTSGVLIYDNKWKIEVEPENTADISRDSYNASFQFVLKAPYPYWKSITESKTSLTGIEAVFKYPLTYKEPHMFGQRIESSYQNIYNNGNVPIPFMIEFVAKTTVKNPQIFNMKTLEFIRINKTIEAGEVIRINMTGGTLDITSTINGITTNAFGFFDIDSTIFKLEIGENLLKSEAEVNSKGLYSTIYYNTTTAGVYGDDITYF